MVIAHHRTATTLPELLIVLAILALLASIAFVTLDPGWSFARDFAGRVHAARARAVVFGRLVGVGVVRCHDTVDVDWSDVSGAHVVAFPARGLMFTPEGLPRTCDGGGVGNATILLEHRGRRAAVIVSSLGRVRWERR